jgi:class 3 adenylate cyclase
VSATSGERRVVSVLIADIADSTTIGERLGPERSKFLFDEVIRLIAAEVKRYGGTVAQLTGDGLYALFGAPTAHDDDAERAVRAALAVKAALSGYGRDVAQAYEIDLAARIGVNTGPVVLLPEEAPSAQRYNALGDTVNVAARLQAHAGPNGVAVGQATARQVDSIFELEPLGALELKGKAEPVQGYGVVGEREGVQRRVSLLVGRARSWRSRASPASARAGSPPRRPGTGRSPCGSSRRRGSHKPRRSRTTRSASCCAASSISA